MAKRRLRIVLSCLPLVLILLATFITANAWETFAAPDRLVNDRVLSTAVDADGATWFGTVEGVSRFDDQDWTTYTTANGLAGNYVYTIAAGPNGSVWFGTRSGTSRFDGTRWTTYTTADGLVHNTVRSRRHPSRQIPPVRPAGSHAKLFRRLVRLVPY